MLTSISADIMEKLKILSDAAKFDVACTSSGASRSGNGNDMGSATLMVLMVVHLVLYARHSMQTNYQPSRCCFW